MEPKSGNSTTCSQCGQRIVFIGPYWQHIGKLQPKHPAIPIEIWGERRTVLVHDVWLRTMGDRIQVLVNDCVVIDEYAPLGEVTISHNVTALGIEEAFKR